MEHVLPTLIESARTARDRQAAQLRQAQGAVQQARTTLERLGQFRAECLARSAAGTLGHTDGPALGRYQRFIARLDEASALQQRELQLRTERAEREQQALVHCQQRLLAFQALAQRRLREREHRENRRLQREADEFAARAFHRAARENEP